MKLSAEGAIIAPAKLRDYLLPSPYGQKYESLGPLTGPNGATAWVRTIWIILTKDKEARLVTLIPEERP